MYICKILETLIWQVEKYRYMNVRPYKRHVSKDVVLPHTFLVEDELLDSVKT